MLREFTGEDKADRGLDLARRNGGLLVVGGELRGLSRNTLKNVYCSLDWSRLEDACGGAYH